MLRLLRWLFTGDGHMHKWRTLKSTERGVWTAYHQQCEVCGTVSEKVI